MSLHPVLVEKLSAALEEGAPAALTRRDARLPEVAGKVHAVIGMRRAGKSTFLRQLLDERRATRPAERAIYLGFDDDRLAGLELEQLAFLLEEYYRRHPALRGRETVSWFLDEIQLVSGWERFVRRVLESEKVEIIVSGSSAWTATIRPASWRRATWSRARSTRRCWQRAPTTCTSTSPICSINT